MTRQRSASRSFFGHLTGRSRPGTDSSISTSAARTPGRSHARHRRDQNEEAAPLLSHTEPGVSLSGQSSHEETPQYDESVPAQMSSSMERSSDKLARRELEPLSAKDTKVWRKIQAFEASTARLTKGYYAQDLGELTRHAMHLKRLCSSRNGSLTREDRTEENREKLMALQDITLQREAKQHSYEQAVWFIHSLKDQIGDLNTFRPAV